MSLKSGYKFSRNGYESLGYKKWRLELRGGEVYVSSCLTNERIGFPKVPCARRTFESGAGKLEVLRASEAASYTRVMLRP